VAFAGATVEHYIDWFEVGNLFTNGIPNVVTGGYAYVESLSPTNAGAVLSAYPPSVTNDPLYTLWPTTNDVPATLSTSQQTWLQQPSEHLWFTVWTNSLDQY
jgi:hypothetical protein